MKNSEVIRIAIAESSIIIRSGMMQALKRLPNLKILSVELASVDALRDCIRSQPPHILMVNPTFGDYFDVAQFRAEASARNIRLVALVSAFTDATLLSKYDESISIFDSLEVINDKINLLQNIKPQEEENPDALSQREKEIIVCVVKGMTNKEIAEKLYLSIHTVITHRRNISRKLQIHSASGLTIYAIVNKLVELNDIKI
ncbi:LuxR C-terminal-related transcriptional regulator [Bacteroides sp. 519]|uniref:helix-turn-helix transcriptional regulator n=1 Tax=Bacteroides sp. 519 TaxID=2302937 RepID=UPI0013D2A434|nr:LuxR C-terminal-related transcriptional regulator [Bacteroides sp. 519]NDV59846.1 DNA-binding response regulator [Bacteroides sp. 519]